MNSEMLRVVERVVDNLQYTRVTQVIDEILNEDPFFVRTALQNKENNERLGSAETYFEIAKRRFLERALTDAKQIDNLMNLPKWLGFQLDPSLKDATEDVTINKAKNAAISSIWISTIARSLIGTPINQEVLKGAVIDNLIRGLLQSDETRRSSAAQIASEIDRKGIHSREVVFDKSLDGYNTEIAVSRKRVPQYIALMMMATTSIEYDIDKILTSNTDDLVNETTACILLDGILRFIKNLIQGSRYHKPFDWPMTGDRKVCRQLALLSMKLEDLASQLECVSLFRESSTDEEDKTISERTIGIILQEITEHYNDTLKRKHGKWENKELRRFINLLISQKEDLSNSILESQDQGNELYLQLLSLKRMARSGHKPILSPEKRYRDYLTSLEMKLRVASRSEDFASLFIPEIDRIFGVTTEVIRKYNIGLEDDTDAFTEALCFETSLRVLEYMKMEHLLLHLPWISRFIAEEAVNPYTEIAIFDVVSEEHCTERIAAAYKAGLLYLVLQEKRTMDAESSTIGATM